MTIHEIIRRPVVTEKGVAAKDEHATLCFEVALGANKTQVKQAVEKLFKVKVAGRADLQPGRQDAPPRPLRGIQAGLEEGLREVERRGKGARLCADLGASGRWGEWASGRLCDCGFAPSPVRPSPLGSEF